MNIWPCGCSGGLDRFQPRFVGAGRGGRNMDSTEIQLPSNRRFGTFLLTMLIVVTSVFLFYGYQHTAAWFCGTALLVAVVLIFNANLLSPLNKAWMTFGFFLGSIISPIILAVIFFGMFFPISIIIKVLGRDELALKTRRQRSLWKRRSSDTVYADSFRRQF